jgi:hypothetical protein
MGDVAEPVDIVLRRIGIAVEWDDWPDLIGQLHELGVKTLYGTSLGD